MRSPEVGGGRLLAVEERNATLLAMRIAARLLEFAPAQVAGQLSQLRAHGLSLDGALKIVDLVCAWRVDAGAAARLRELVRTPTAEKAAIKASFPETGDLYLLRATCTHPLRRVPVNNETGQPWSAEVLGEKIVRQLLLSEVGGAGLSRIERTRDRSKRQLLVKTIFDNFKPDQSVVVLQGEVTDAHLQHLSKDTRFANLNFLVLDENLAEDNADELFPSAEFIPPPWSEPNEAKAWTALFTARNKVDPS